MALLHLIASKSTDIDGSPCVTFLFEFGDDTPPNYNIIPDNKNPYYKLFMMKFKLGSDKYGRQSTATVDVSINTTKILIQQKNYQNLTKYVPSETPGANKDLMDAFQVLMNGI